MPSRSHAVVTVAAAMALLVVGEALGYALYHFLGYPGHWFERPALNSTRATISGLLGWGVVLGTAAGTVSLGRGRSWRQAVAVGSIVATVGAFTTAVLLSLVMWGA